MTVELIFTSWSKIKFMRLDANEYPCSFGESTRGHSLPSIP